MKKRTKQQKISSIQTVLERHGRFDYEYIPFLGTWDMPDEKFPYRQKGFDLVCTYFWRTLMWMFGRLLIGVLFGARVVGKQNLRALKKRGAICICNHFNYLDTLFVRAAVGHFRSYHTMGPQNNKRGLGGWIVRHGGMLPLSADLRAMRRLNDEMERLLNKGKIINFYPEKALWTNYPKPRPMKDGAFHYAVKYQVPVLPVFCTFSKNKRGRVRKLRIHILPAVEADKSLPRRVQVAAMKEAAFLEWQNCYEAAYGVPLAYLGSDAAEISAEAQK